MKQKSILFLALSLVLSSVLIAACTGADTVSQEAIQTAIAETQQVEDAIQQGIAATQAAQSADDAFVEDGETEEQPVVPTDSGTEDETAAATPSTPVEEVEPFVAAETNVEFEGIKFNLDYSLFSTWTVEITSPPDPESDNPFQSPSYYHFEFQDDAIDEDALEFSLVPTLIVIPVQNMETFLDTGYGLERLALLQNLLAARPDVIENSMPVLPYNLTFNSSEVLHTNLEYLDFQNGSGVRFLATYAQAPFPVVGLSYYFQGLTNDGAYYISLSIPVDETALAELNAPYASGFADDDAYDAFIDNYEPYLASAENLLNNAGNASFSPDLLLLDAITQSIYIDR